MQGTNWVKCSDKMPEVGKPVIVKLGTMLHIMFIEDGAWTNGEWVRGVDFKWVKVLARAPTNARG
ncbi:DUF551 domain-containing protein [Providencia rettgeri]